MNIWITIQTPKNKAIDLTGKLDCRPVDNIDLSVSGNSPVIDRFNPGDDNTTGLKVRGLLLNWDNNPVHKQIFYRVNARFFAIVWVKLATTNSPQDGDAEVYQTSKICYTAYKVVSKILKQKHKITTGSIFLIWISRQIS